MLFLLQRLNNYDFFHGIHDISIIIAEDLKIAYSTAQRGIQKLEVANIIQKTSDNKRDKVYCASKIPNILEKPTRINSETDE